jgi:hypothetical protein
MTHRAYAIPYLARILLIGALLASWPRASPVAAQDCEGDCNDNGEVTLGEVQIGFNMFLGTATMGSCRLMDSNDDGEVSLGEVQLAFNNFLTDCGSKPPPTLRPSASPTPTATPTPRVLNVAGTWQVHEDIDARNCGAGFTTDDYRGLMRQDGSHITWETDFGVFEGMLDGNRISWTGEYFNPEEDGWVRVTSLSVTVSGSSFSGSSRWEFRFERNGPLVCSGRTEVSGTRL